MFEDVIFSSRRRQTGTTHNRLHHVLQEDALNQVLSSVEQEGQWAFTGREKAEALRRLRKYYRKRRYPEVTFEDWHFGRNQTDIPEDMPEDVPEDVPKDVPKDTAEGVPANPAPKKKRKTSRKKKAARNQLLLGSLDFDDFVRRSVVQELREEREKLPVGPAMSAGPSTQPEPENGSSSSDSDSDSDSDTSEDSEDDSDGSDGSVSETDTDRKSHDAESESDDSEIEAHADSKPDLVDARRKLKKWANFDTTRSSLRDHYALRKAGYEVSADIEDRKHLAVRQQHILSLKAIVHLKILEKDWHTALKAFSALTKLANVDMRSLWPLGIEILTRLRDEARDKARKNGDTSKTRAAGRSEQRKIRHFFDWVMLFFPLYMRPVASLAPNNGPVFRTGSMTHAPMYRVAALWDLLTEKQYTQLRDTLEEMLLMPPYAHDGTFYYMLVLCCLSENSDLLILYEGSGNLDDILDLAAEMGDFADDMVLLSSKDAIKTRIFENNTQLATLMDKCESLRFHFSREMVETEMENARNRLARISPPIVEKSTPKTDTFQYSFQRGTVAPAKSHATAIPRKYWDRLISRSEIGGSKTWIGIFFDYSKANVAVCLVCGETLERNKDLKGHLQGHDITPENYRKKRSAVKEMNMARMVKAQQEAQQKAQQEAQQNAQQEINVSVGQPRIRKETKPKGQKKTDLSERSSVSSLENTSPPDSANALSSQSKPKRKPRATTAKKTYPKAPVETNVANTMSAEDALSELFPNFEIPFDGDTGSQAMENDTVLPEQTDNDIPEYPNSPLSQTLGRFEVSETAVDHDSAPVVLPNSASISPEPPNIASISREPVNTEEQIPEIKDDPNFGDDSVAIPLERDTANEPHTRPPPFEATESDQSMSIKHESATELPSDNAESPFPNNIDDSMDAHRIANSQKPKSTTFGGFSPDTTQENQTFALDMSRDISQNFHQFATQTQASQVPNIDENSNQHHHEWRDEFSMDSNYADSSVNFTRFISDSFLGKEDANQEDNQAANTSTDQRKSRYGSLGSVSEQDSQEANTY